MVAASINFYLNLAIHCLEFLLEKTFNKQNREWYIILVYFSFPVQIILVPLEIQWYENKLS